MLKQKKQTERRQRMSEFNAPALMRMMYCLNKNADCSFDAAKIKKKRKKKKKDVKRQPPRTLPPDEENVQSSLCSVLLFLVAGGEVSHDDIREVMYTGLFESIKSRPRGNLFCALSVS